MKYREFILSSGTKILLGKDAKSNDELVGEFKGKENLIIHTVAPGSPFCVIESLNPTKEDIKEASIICASKSQDWRDNNQDVELHLFSGKNVKKPLLAKAGTWKVTSNPKIIKIKKEDIRRQIKIK